MSEIGLLLKTRTLCVPNCGAGAPIDEDGCCATCGCDAVGKALEGLIDELDALRSIAESGAPPVEGVRRIREMFR